MADQELVLDPWQSILDNLKINSTEEPRGDDSMEQVAQALIVLFGQVVDNHRQERREELQAQSNATRETTGQILQIAQAQSNASGETIGQILQFAQAQSNASGETIGQLVQVQGQLLHAVINNYTEQRR